MKTIKINGEYLELGKLLKIANVISSGGEAKYYLQENNVLVNGEVENRRGKKLYPGDVVKIENEEYTIKWSIA